MKKKICKITKKIQIKLINKMYESIDFLLLKMSAPLPINRIKTNFNPKYCYFE